MSVLSWGSNKHGELGIIFEGMPKTFSVPKSITSIEGNPVSVASGEGHSLIVMETGDIYSCGRGREGQLGLGNDRNDSPIPQRIESLQNEYILAVAAGAMTSYAITAAGTVYQWGLIQKNSQSRNDQGEAVAAGQLTGLAQDQNQELHVDREIYRHTFENVHEGAARKLRDIVNASTNKWLLANDDANMEYYDELRSMGYENEELEERIQDREREYHGMLRVGCHRVPKTSPERIPGISHLRVASLSAGYAHCLLLTDTGRMYSSGYNDRGQLGLGHRISTADFTLIDKMEHKFVIQVVCGQQHSLCRAIDRNIAMRDNITAGADIGADVFIWGSGILGQLGMGRKGTSKGRLSPTVIPDLLTLFPQGIIHAASGANFSVVVSVTGEVWSWGHSEYNQHGTGTRGASDYIDPYYFFSPRKVQLPTSTTDPIVKLSCGSNFTIALTSAGEAYSWGWGAYGALGHGDGHVSSQVSKIAKLGPSSSDNTVMSVAAGASHVLAIVSSASSSWAAGNSLLLESGDFADVEISIEGYEKKQSSSSFMCHRVILSARSSYFKGFIRAASQDPSMTHITHDKNSVEGKEATERAVLQIVLDASSPSVMVTPLLVKAMLDYIYTDNFTVPNNMYLHLESLAKEFSLDGLASRASRAHRLIYESEDVRGLIPSTFATDMMTMVNSKEFADVLFYSTLSFQNDGSCVNCVNEDELSLDQSMGTVESKNDYSNEKCNVSSSPTTTTKRILYGHKCLLTRLEYFKCLFHSKFRENQRTENSSFSSSTNDDNNIHCNSDIIHFNLDSFAEDGIDFASFRKLLLFVYTGTLDDLDDVFSSLDTIGEIESEYESEGNYITLYIAGNRLGLPMLVRRCEYLLYTHLNDYPANIENCMNFAQSYGIPRLEKLCKQLIELKNSEFSIGNGTLSDYITPTIYPTVYILYPFEPHQKSWLDLF
eukprot:gene366-669_t